MARQCRWALRGSAVVPRLEQQPEPARGLSVKVLRSSPPVAATPIHFLIFAKVQHNVVEDSLLVGLAATRQQLVLLEPSTPAPPMREATRRVRPMCQQSARRTRRARPER